MFKVIRLTELGLARIPGSSIGMTFPVDKFTAGCAGLVAHVRDYRYPGERREFQIWSIPADGYEIIVPDGYISEGAATHG